MTTHDRSVVGLNPSWRDKTPLAERRSRERRLHLRNSCPRVVPVGLLAPLWCFSSFDVGPDMRPHAPVCLGVCTDSSASFSVDPTFDLSTACVRMCVLCRRSPMLHQLATWFFGTQRNASTILSVNLNSMDGSAGARTPQSCGTLSACVCALCHLTSWHCCQLIIPASMKPCPSLICLSVNSFHLCVSSTQIVV